MSYPPPPPPPPSLPSPETPLNLVKRRWWQFSQNQQHGNIGLGKKLLTRPDQVKVPRLCDHRPSTSLDSSLFYRVTIVCPWRADKVIPRTLCTVDNQMGNFTELVGSICILVLFALFCVLFAVFLFHFILSSLDTQFTKSQHKANQLPVQVPHRQPSRQRLYIHKIIFVHQSTQKPQCKTWKTDNTYLQQKREHYQYTINENVFPLNPPTPFS